MCSSLSVSWSTMMDLRAIYCTGKVMNKAMAMMVWGEFLFLGSLDSMPQLFWRQHQILCLMGYEFKNGHHCYYPAHDSSVTWSCLLIGSNMREVKVSICCRVYWSVSEITKACINLKSYKPLKIWQPAVEGVWNWGWNWKLLTFIIS